MSERFHTEFNKTRKSSKNTVFLSNEKYDEVLHEVSLLKNGQKKKKTTRDYWMLQRYLSIFTKLLAIYYNFIGNLYIFLFSLFLVFIGYDILVTQQNRKLIFPESGEGKVLFYVNKGELCEILKAR
jgi:hypothetical protein